MKDKKKFSIFKYFRAKKITVLFYVLLTALSYSMGVVGTYKMSQFLEYISEGNFEIAIKAFLITAICIVCARLALWLSCVFFYKFGSYLGTEIKRDLFKRCIDFSSNSFNKISSGKLNTRIINDPENIIWAMDGLVDAFAQVVGGLIVVIFIMTYNIYIGLIMLVTIIGLVCFESFKQSLYNKNSKKLNKLYEKLSTQSFEIIRSEKDIKSLNMEKTLEKQSESTLAEYNKAFSRKFQTNSSLWSLRSLLVELAIIGVVFLSITLLENAYLGISAFLFVILNKNSVQDIVWSLGRIADNFTTCKIATNRITELMDDSKFGTETFGDEQLENCKGQIEFKNVSFSYEEYDLSNNNDEEKNKNSKKGKTEPKPPTQKQVFKNFSMEIPANKTVALVGRSGCGKSTILNLIPKLYTADEGEVLIDGKNVNTLSREAIRDNISLVSQFPYIFDTTIKENLLLAKPNATDEEIMSVVKKANMDFLESMPKGIDTIVGEGGIKLSGGQKQRLAIARALLRNTRIILFDESTSSLDNFSQNEIKKSIDALSHNSTVVIVAHRLSTIKNADIIYFMDDGKVEAQGTFDELFATNEKFQKLFVAENV